MVAAWVSGSSDALTGIAERARAGGLTVEVGGDALQAQAEQGLAEVVGVAVAAVVLIITFGSLLAAGLPLLTALLTGLVTAGAVQANAAAAVLGYRLLSFWLILPIGVATYAGLRRPVPDPVGDPGSTD